MILRPVGSAAALLFLLGTSPLAHADGDVSIVLTPRGQQLATDLGLSVAELEAEVEAEIAEAYGTANVDGFLRSFANAASFGNRGVGVDYASNSDVVLGVSANAAVSVEDFSGDNGYPVGGASVNLAAMAGLNLGRFASAPVASVDGSDDGGDAGSPGMFHLSRFTVFANGFHYATEFGPLEGGLTTVGAHLQYKLIEDTGGKMATLVKWGGIDLTAGVEYSRWNLTLRRSLTTDVPIDGANGSTSAELVANGRFDVSTSAFVLPLEATTSLRVAYLLAVYGGVGIDVQVGKASVDASVQGTVSAIDPNTNMPADIGSATVTMSGSQGASPGRARALLGVQLNLWKLKLVAQLNYMPAATASGMFGVRLAF